MNDKVKTDDSAEKKDVIAAPVERLVITDEDCAGSVEHKLAMALSEAEDHRRAATRLADALQLVYNDVGEIEEVAACYASVGYDVSNYKGLDG